MAKAEGTSRERGAASVVICPIMLVGTVRRGRRDRNVSGAVDVNASRRGTLGGRKSRVSSMLCKALVRNA